MCVHVRILEPIPHSDRKTLAVNARRSIEAALPIADLVDRAVAQGDFWPRLPDIETPTLVRLLGEIGRLPGVAAAGITTTNSGTTNSGGAAVRIEVPTSGRLRATLTNMRGQRLQLLHDAPVPAGAALELQILTAKSILSFPFELKVDLP